MLRALNLLNRKVKICGIILGENQVIIDAILVNNFDGNRKSKSQLCAKVELISHFWIPIKHILLKSFGMMGPKMVEACGGVEWKRVRKMLLDESVKMIFPQELWCDAHFPMTSQILTGLMTKENGLSFLFFDLFCYHDVYTWALIQLVLMKNNLRSNEVKLFAY